MTSELLQGCVIFFFSYERNYELNIYGNLISNILEYVNNAGDETAVLFFDQRCVWDSTLTAAIRRNLDDYRKLWQDRGATVLC